MQRHAPHASRSELHLKAQGGLLQGVLCLSPRQRVDSEIAPILRQAPHDFHRHQGKFEESLKNKLHLRETFFESRMELDYVPSEMNSCKRREDKIQRKNSMINTNLEGGC